MVPGEPDDDYPDDEPADECLLNWGADPADYAEQFRAALVRKRRGEPIGVEITALIANMAAFLEVSGDPYADPLIKHAREVLSAPQPQQIPEGYNLVPIEPTKEMLHAAATSGGLGMDYHEYMGRFTLAYKAAIKVVQPTTEKL